MEKQATLKRQVDKKFTKPSGYKNCNTNTFLIHN